MERQTELSSRERKGNRVIAHAPTDSYREGYVRIFGDKKAQKFHKVTGTRRKPNDGIITHSWVTGWWEHIDKNPIYIKDKTHLIHECEKRGVLAKAFMKPHSQERRLVHA